jgi:hypothetical protein
VKTRRTFTGEGVCFYSLYGLTIEVRWTGKGVEEEIKKFFAPFPFTKLDNAGEQTHIKLKFAVSDIPATIPYQISEPRSCYGLLIFENSDYIFLTDELSAFKIQPRTGIGQATFHHSFREKSLLSKYNFFLIGLMYLLTAQGLHDLHGAGLVRDETGYLFLGDSGSGKSTAALTLVHQGWHYLSDDTLLIRRAAVGSIDHKM